MKKLEQQESKINEIGHLLNQTTEKIKNLDIDSNG